VVLLLHILYSGITPKLQVRWLAKRCGNVSLRDEVHLTLLMATTMHGTAAHACTGSCRYIVQPHAILQPFQISVCHTIWVNAALHSMLQNILMLSLLSVFLALSDVLAGHSDARGYHQGARRTAAGAVDNTAMKPS
jgi:hypothetical protein